MAQGEERSMQLPHRLSLEERKKLTVAGVTEVGSFDETGAPSWCGGKGCTSRPSPWTEAR